MIPTSSYNARLSPLGLAPSGHDEVTLDGLWRSVRLSVLVFTAIFIVGMLWRSFGLNAWVGIGLVAFAAIGIAASSIRVVLSLAYRPWPVHLLIGGGSLLIMCLLIQTAGHFSRFDSWPVLSGRNLVHRTVVDVCGWAGVGCLFASFYLSLVEAAIAQGRLLLEREHLRREIEQRLRTEIELRLARDELELRVKARTAELVTANHELSCAVTDHQLTAQRLIESEERFRQVAATAGEWIWELDVNGCYTYSSQAVTDLLGFEPAEVLGRNWRQFLAPGEPETLADMNGDAKSLLSSGESTSKSRRSDWKLRRDSRWVLHETTVTANLDRNGVLTGYRGVSRDVTYQKQMERQMQQTRNMELLGQLASGVSHDFSNLISVISGCVRSVGDTLPEGHAGRPMIDVLEEAVQQAIGVTRSLTLLGNHLPIELAHVDLVACLEQTRRLLLHLLPPHIRFELHLPTSTPVWVMADVTQLQQVLLNLAINARDAMPEAGVLSISLSVIVADQLRDPPPVVPVATHYARIDISDTGIGIPVEWQLRVFEPFFTTKARGSGTGLGLAIVDSIVKNHGGWIRLRSDSGGGTTFSISLPCDLKNSRDQCEPKVQEEMLDILVCLEHRVLRGLVTSLVRSRGHRVVVALDGSEIVNRVECTPSAYRLMIVDDAFIEAMGNDVILGVHRLNPNLRVLAIRTTKEPSSAMQDNRIHTMDLPFDSERFGRSIECLLTNRSTEYSYEHHSIAGG